MTGDGVTPWARRRPLLALAAMIALGVGGSLLFQRPRVELVTVRPSPALAAIVEAPGDPAAGASVASADVRVLVFTDYQCPVCRETDPAHDAVLATDPRVRIVYKDWPIFGDASRQAARLALAAARQGRYRDIHRKLMGADRPLTPETLMAIARAAGVDVARARADLDRDGAAFDADLARHAREARSLGLEGTPGYVIGTRIARGGLRLADLRRLIAQSRRMAAPPP